MCQLKGNTMSKQSTLKIGDKSIVAVDGKITITKEALLGFLGVTADDVQGHSDEEICHYFNGTFLDGDDELDFEIMMPTHADDFMFPLKDFIEGHHLKLEIVK